MANDSTHRFYGATPDLEIERGEEDWAGGNYQGGPLVLGLAPGPCTVGHPAPLAYCQFLALGRSRALGRSLLTLILSACSTTILRVPSRLETVARTTSTGSAE